MKDTNVKAKVAKVITVGILAGAFVLAAPMKAEAQDWRFGVQFGGPVYVGDDDGRREHWEHEQQEAFARQQAYLQQQAWAQQQGAYDYGGYVGGYGYSGDGDGDGDGGYGYRGYGDRGGDHREYRGHEGNWGRGHGDR